MTFNSLHSPLENNNDILQSLVTILEKNLGNKSEVIGVIEIGSFAKGEAIPSSDIDTRIYLTCPDYYIWQPVISRFNESQKYVIENRFIDFENECGKLPKKEYEWWTFTNSLAEKIGNTLGINIEFGFVDYRYADFELKHLDSFVTPEHALLLQSNIVYDPLGTIAQMRKKINGRKFNPLVSFYQERYLDKLPFEIYQHLKKDATDDFKIKKSRQIQWVKWAVRCLRDAVASKTYIVSGNFIFKKSEVLDFYKYYLPEDYEFIQRIYLWKTNEEIREKMVNDFLDNRDNYFQLFNSMMPQLESVVEKVNKVELRS